MISSQTNRYVIELESKIYQFFLLDNSLHFEIIDDKNKVKSIISKNIIIYAAAIDDLGFLRLASIDSFGNLTLYSYNGSFWDKTAITKLNMHSYGYDNLNLFINNNETHILLLEYQHVNKGLYNLIHYSITYPMWRSRRIAKIHSSEFRPIYKADMDTWGNIHLIYKTVDKKKNQLFYRLFNNNYRKWINPEKISNKDYDVLNLSILPINDTVHLAYSYNFEKIINTDYLQKKVTPFINGKWTKKEDLNSSLVNIGHTFFVHHIDNLKMIWKKDDTFYIATYDFRHNIWNTIEKIFVSNYNFYPINYLKLDSSYRIKIKAPLTYYKYENNNLVIVGVNLDGTQSKNNKLTTNQTFYEANPKGINLDTNNIFTNYFNKLAPYFEKTSLVKDLSYNLAQKNSTTKNNFTDFENLEVTDIVDKVILLYKELESLKNKELTIINSLLEIKKDYDELYEKIVFILENNKYLDERGSLSRFMQPFNKFINVFNSNTFANIKKEDR